MKALLARLSLSVGKAVKSTLGRVLLAVTALFLIAALLCRLHAFDGVAGATIDAKQASKSLFLYWLVLSLALTFALDRTRRARIVLSVLSITFAVLMGELAVRVLHHDHATAAYKAVFSPRFHHAMPPNATMTAKFVQGHDCTITTNEDGFRTAYSRATFLQKKRRIAFLGDSYTMGLSLPVEQAVPQTMERLLGEEQKGSDIGVLNTGVVSYSPFIEKLLFRDVVKDYHPELVFLILDATDIADDYVYARASQERDGVLRFLREGAWLVPDEPTLLDRSALYQRLLPDSFFWVGLFTHPIESAKVQSIFVQRNLKIDIPGARGSRFFIFKQPLEQTRRYFETTLRNISEVAAMVKQTGAEFVLVVPPRYQHWNPEECPKNWEKREYGTNEPHQFDYLRFFDEARERVDFPIVNLLPAFKASKEFPLVFETDPHWTEKGAALVARALTDYVIEHRLAGTAPAPTGGAPPP